ncbi:MAG: alcohol dehydrogenase [Candidatus Rokuibacteriota bacterium]|nr:MAG: alcohol dehydrogenase [Candidatus Rokubacteria bacterium]
MPMDANAAVLYEVNKPLVIEDVEVLEPGPHEVRVRWAANGVCHSDLHVMTGDYPHPLPVVLGHEAAGVVEKIGAGVESVKPGDHVCSSYIPSCGKCWYCIGGQPTMCALRDKPRWFMLDGTSRFRKNGQPLHHFLQVSGYATHSVLLEESVIPIRKDAPLDLACLVSCGVLAGAGPVFNRAKVPPGASVAVFGCGGVGLNTIQAARMVGAGKIIAVDVNPQKLTWAEEFGATHVVDASKEDPVARVQAIGGIGGVDFAFEVVGTQKTIEQALASTHRGGMWQVPAQGAGIASPPAQGAEPRLRPHEAGRGQALRDRLRVASRRGGESDDLRARRPPACRLAGLEQSTIAAGHRALLKISFDSTVSASISFPETAALKCEPPPAWPVE